MRVQGWICVLLLAGLIAACSNNGRRYSDDPEKAYKLTRDYLQTADSYSATQNLASLSVGRIDLGKKLFHDPRLSYNGQLACATCHNPEQGYTQNGRALPPGAHPATRGRNAPSLYDVVMRTTLHADGRAGTLEVQAANPLTQSNEMGNPSMTALSQRVRAMDDYDRFFLYAFGGEATPDNIAAALSAYQRTLLTGPNAFDRWKYKGRRRAMTAQQIRGYELFAGKAGCASCHTIGAQSATFTDEAFHDTGYAKTKPPGIAELDTGRHGVTGRDEDMYAFRTPSLRNVALTAPYMHDGRLKTLDEVVAFFDRSYALNLAAQERADIVAFLNALTSRNRP